MVFHDMVRFLESVVHCPQRRDAVQRDRDRVAKQEEADDDLRGPVAGDALSQPTPTAPINGEEPYRPKPVFRKLIHEGAIPLPKYLHKRTWAKEKGPNGALIKLVNKYRQLGEWANSKKRREGSVAGHQIKLTLKREVVRAFLWITHMVEVKGHGDTNVLVGRTVVLFCSGDV